MVVSAPTPISPHRPFAKRVAERLFESLTFRLRSPVFLSSRDRVHPVSRRDSEHTRVLGGCHPVRPVETGQVTQFIGLSTPVLLCPHGAHLPDAPRGARGSGHSEVAANGLNKRRCSERNGLGLVPPETGLSSGHRTPWRNPCTRAEWLGNRGGQIRTADPRLAREDRPSAPRMAQRCGFAGHRRSERSVTTCDQELIEPNTDCMGQLGW
jgi:hypothetical protein